MFIDNIVPVSTLHPDCLYQEIPTPKVACLFGIWQVLVETAVAPALISIYLTSAPFICQCDFQISCVTYKPWHHSERSRSSRWIILRFLSLRNRVITDPAESVKPCLLIIFLYLVPYSTDTFILLVLLAKFIIYGQMKKMKNSGKQGSGVFVS